MKNYFINFKFENIIILLMPAALISGPAIPDIMAFCLIIYFLICLIKKKNFYINDNYWIYLSFLLWFWFIIISFFAYDILLSFKDAIIFVRYVIFIIAIVYFFKNLNVKSLELLLYMILCCTLFVTLDTLFQFYNYDNLEGFKGDIFGIQPTGLYGRLSGPFKDLVPGSYLSRFYFINIFLIILFKNKLKNNIFILSSVIIILTLIFSVIYFSGERIALATTIMGVFISIIFLKSSRNIVICSMFFSIFFIFVNQTLHPHFNNYKVIKDTARHEGLIIERNFKCKNNKVEICSKQFVVQPYFLTILKNFNQSAYGELYETSIQMWKDNKITGIGLNNFEKMCKNENLYNQYHKIFGCGTHSHNYYIQALTETGIIGLIIFVFLIILFLYNCFNSKTNEMKIISIITLLVLFWPIMSTGSFLKNWNMIFICYLVGIIFGLKTKEFKFHN